MINKGETLLMDKRPCKGEGFIRADWDSLTKTAVPLMTENAEVVIN